MKDKIKLPKKKEKDSILYINIIYISYINMFICII